MLQVAYFSSVSENTRRFVENLDVTARRIPLYPSEPPLVMLQPYVLIAPTYGGGSLKGAVPKQVIKFLNEETNRIFIRGVVSMGNMNFGEAFGSAGDIIGRKCGVPHFYRVELMGTPLDRSKVLEGIQILTAQEEQKEEGKLIEND